MIIDHRERKHNDPNTAVPKILERMGVSFQKAQLPVGDYIMQGETLTAGVELKNAGDYINSIKKGRINDQLLNMSSNFDYPILLVYGSPTDALLDTEMKRSTWFHFLAGCVTDISPVGKGSRVSVIMVENEYDAAFFLQTLDKKISSGEINREPSLKKVKAPKEKQLLYHVMWMFPPECHIGKKRAQLLLTHYSTIQNLVNTTVDELKNIDSIGEKIAKRMVSHISSDSRRESRSLVSGDPLEEKNENI